MMTKFMNKQRGLLAAIMALVMVFAGAAFVAADVDASDNTPVAKIGETEFLTLDAAIVAANSMINATIEILNDATYNGTSPQEGMTIDGKNKQITFNEKMRIGSKTVGGQFTLKDATIVIADSCHSMFLDTQSGDYYGQNVNVLIQNITITSEKTDLTIYFNGWNGRTYTLDNVSGTYKAVLSGISGIPSMELSKIQGIDVEVTTEGSETVALSTTNDAKINVLGSKGGVSVTVKEKSNLTVTTLEDVTVNASGTIKYDNIVGESKVVSGDVVVDKQGAIVDSFEDAALAFSAGAKDVILGKEENGKFVNSTVYLNNNEFTVPAGKTLTINNATVYSYNEPKEGTGATDIGSIKVLGTLYLESADVRASISTEGDDAEIIVTKAKKMTVTGDSTADLGVGYGNTLVLADLIVPAGKYIEAYGTVIIEGTVTVQSNNGFHIYKGGNAQIDGALVIEKTATIDGEAVINGSVKVYNADGDAGLTVNGDVTVLGTMDILKPKTKGADNNVLTVGQYGDLDVEGTLTITGKLSGKVCDMGTIVFNGVADNATIAVFDGVTLTIAAVDGDLTITDDGIVDVAEYNTGTGYYISLGNDVVLNDIKNVTVSVTLDETASKDSTGKSIRLIASEMTVTGTVSAFDDAVGGTVDISAATASAEYDSDKNVQGTVTIGDITLGKLVVMDIQSENVTVAGTVNVAAQGSDLDVTGDIVIDVTGTIINITGGNTSAATIEIDGKFNGASYKVVDANMNYTYYYTTFENAVAAIADAYENVIEVSGEVEVASALEIPAGAELLMGAGDIMNIDVDGKLTIAADALLEASSAEIDVDGMLVIMDKESGLNAPAKDKFSYQVYTVDGETETYSGLVLALKNASAGDVITVVGTDGTIEKSVTIPEGVTLEVPKNTKLTIGDSDDATNDVILTVNGTLKVSGEVVGVNSAEIVTNGIVIAADEVNSIKNVEMDDYVEFTMKVDGRNVHVHSNLAYAAENAVDGQVRIVGDISGGDVTFTQSDKGALSILVDNGSTLTVGTLTLIGNGAILTANGETTGTIAAAAGSVDLDKVSGIVVSVIINEDVDGTTDVVTIFGTLAGKMSVASGTVTVNDDDDNNENTFTVGSSKDDILTVASGATLAVPADAELIVDDMATATGVTQYYGLVIDGTLAVNKGAVTITGEALVNGDVSIVDTNDVEIDGKLVVIGNVTVSSTTETKYALDIDGVLIIGSIPSIGANGTLVGNVAFETSGNSMAIAYAGADVSGALFDENNGESSADATEIYVNGALFMTVYISQYNSGITTAIIDDYMVVNGYLAPVWYVDGKVAQGGISDISLYERIDAVMEYDSIGLTVSAGVGLKVYIDGLSVENYKVGDVYKIQLGTHTVSFAVESGYDGSAATITVNGVQVSNNGTFTLDVDDKSATIIASGAVPAQSGSTVVVDEDDGMALTDILLIVLVVLIVIMAIIVALRMMRS